MKVEFFDIPGAVTKIKDFAFWGCGSLVSVTIPESLTYIGHIFEGCTGLVAINFKSSTPPYCNSKLDAVDRSLCTLYVPRGCKEAYASARVWAGFENIVEVDSSGEDLSAVGDAASSEERCTVECADGGIVACGKGVDVAVFDLGGRLVHYQRIDGSVFISLDKGVTYLIRVGEVVNKVTLK